MRDRGGFSSYFLAYDIFGYLVPGLVLSGILARANTWWHDNVTAGLYVVRTTSSPPGFAQADYPQMVVAVVLAYVLGHTVAALSSAILEKILLARSVDYPTGRIFGDIRQAHARPRKTRAARFWLLLWTCTRSVLHWAIFGIPWLLVYLAYPTYLEPYSRDMRRRFADRFRDAFGFDPTDGHDIYWLTWSYVSIHHPTAFRRATHFLNLYGFSRNVSMTMFLAALIPWAPGGYTHPLPAAWWAGLFISAGAVMYVNYVKLLRRCDNEIFHALAVLPSPPSSN